MKEQNKQVYYQHHLGGLGGLTLRALIRLTLFGVEKVSKKALNNKGVSKKALNKKGRLIASRRSAILVLLASLDDTKPWKDIGKDNFLTQFESKSFLDSIIGFLPEPMSDAYDEYLRIGRKKFGNHYLLAVKKPKEKAELIVGDTESSLVLKGLTKSEVKITRTTVAGVPKRTPLADDNSPSTGIDVNDVGKHHEDYLKINSSSVNPYQNDQQNRSLADLVSEKSPNHLSVDKDKPNEPKTGIVKLRQGQASFREGILELYGYRCCATGTDIKEVLEAAHIREWSSSKNNDLKNGICLRVDIHRLFDNGLINIDLNFELVVDQSLKTSEYWLLNGKKIALPEQQLDWPDKKHLSWRLAAKKL